MCENIASYISTAGDQNLQRVPLSCHYAIKWLITIYFSLTGFKSF